MSAGLDLQIGYLWQSYFDLGGNIHACAGFMTSAAAQLKADKIENAGYFLDKAADELEEASVNIYSATNSVQRWCIYLFNWIDDNWPENDVDKYELSMLNILAEMAIATPDELMAFIAVTDAYRAALWDKPYNPTYYATFVRHFKLWL